MEPGEAWCGFGFVVVDFAIVSAYGSHWLLREVESLIQKQDAHYIIAAAIE